MKEPNDLLRRIIEEQEVRIEDLRDHIGQYVDLKAEIQEFRMDIQRLKTELRLLYRFASKRMK